MGVKDFLLEIFFPKRCVQCGKFGGFLCFDCAGEIEKIGTPMCPECGRITEFGQYCPRCRGKIKSDLTGLIIAARYDRGPVKEMVHHLKYLGLTELVPLLGELMVLRLKNRLPKGDIVVVPVPLHPKRQAQRGFNQAELLARYISQKLNLPGCLALERLENTESQVKLSGRKRRENLKGMFRVIMPELIAGKIILLVDDVATTGSTLNECAKALETSGAKQVWGAVIARG